MGIKKKIFVGLAGMSEKGKGDDKVETTSNK